MNYCRITQFGMKYCQHPNLHEAAGERRIEYIQNGCPLQWLAFDYVPVATKKQGVKNGKE